MKELNCYSCEYIHNVFGNYVQCGKAAETGTTMFVDWYYWNEGHPEHCPLRKVEDGRIEV